MIRPPSIPRLRVICQREKLRKTNDLTRRHRALSIYATWLLVRTPVTADQVTAASIATGLLGALALAAPGLGAGLAACLLLYVSFLLDQVDGEVARFRRKTSLRGVYLDELRHLVIYAAPVFALGFDVARSHRALWPLGVSFVAGFALALARIEERLPALIYGEKGATENTKIRERVPEQNTSSSVPSVSSVASLLKSVVRSMTAAYELLAHQVLLLGWILLSVLLDRGLGAGFAQGTLAVGLAVATSAALTASVAARLRPGAIEELVRERAKP